MAIDTTITPEIKNDDLYNAYLRCCLAASYLRNNVTCKRKVSNSAFKNFKGNFDFLFILTSNRKQLRNKTIMKPIKEWLLLNTHRATVELSNKGIELFVKYQQLLIDEGLINDKVE